MDRGHRSEAGSLHLGLLLGVVVVIVIGLVGWRVMSAENSKDNTSRPNQTSSNSNQSDTAEPDIKLKNFGLASLDAVAIDTQAVREFKDKGLKGFYVFGDNLSGGRINPNFEFASLKAGTRVVAAIDGVIAFVQEQPETNDYEVFLQPKNGSVWTIGYDHLVNLKVTQGATVKAGDELGEPALQNNGLTRFEIQINKDEPGKETAHVCPSTLLDNSVAESTLSQLQTMQTTWETQTGLELYDLAAQAPVGCYKYTSLSPSQAEGR